MPAYDRRFVLTSAAAAILAAPAIAPATAFGQTPLREKPAYDNYVLATLRMGEVSTEASLIAASRSRTPEVRRFAEIERDEQRTITGILAATGARRTAAPGNAALVRTPDERAWIDRLTDARGEDAIDLAYIEGQIAAHNAFLRVQRSLAGEAEPSIEAITARLLETAAVSHIAMLNLVQQVLGHRRIEEVEQSEQT